MAKQTSFPVKYFKVPGSALSEKQRVEAVRDVMTGRFVIECKAPKQSAKKVCVSKVSKKSKGGPSKRIDVRDTATGSGRVIFSFVKRPEVVITDRSKKRA